MRIRADTSNHIGSEWVYPAMCLYEMLSNVRTVLEMGFLQFNYMSKKVEMQAKRFPFSPHCMWIFATACAKMNAVNKIKREESVCCLKQDFSERMIGLARAKMPQAHLYQGDFSQGLAEAVLQNRYDFIVATYSLHHLKDEDKITMIGSLMNLLKEDGMILIGDVAFADRAGLARCQKEAGDEWDDEEIYFVFDEMQEVFPIMKFEQISDCAGLLSLTR